ncbi:MAG: ribonuclease D, partial [Phenylobacterium sp.]|nr:ribonuclease D [Phenylobacterium sp.]
MANYLHEGDLPAGLFGGVASVAVDSETMGLRLG